MSTCLLLMISSIFFFLISGDNGTIDGQGSVWWDWFRNQNLNYTRPHLIELMHSTGVVISSITFLNSPFWNIHPVYCRFVFLNWFVAFLSQLLGFVNRCTSGVLCVRGRVETVFAGWTAMSTYTTSQFLPLSILQIRMELIQVRIRIHCFSKSF